MLSLIRACRFLSVEDRGSDWLTNIFRSPPMLMSFAPDQEAVLKINQRGKVTTALRASVLFPGMFVRLTTEDRNQFFGGKKFQNWTSSRRIRTPEQFMQKEIGSAVVSTQGIDGVEVIVNRTGRPKRKEAVLNALNERRKGYFSS